jgi:hypothetical protein
MSVSNDTARVQYTLSSGAQALPVTFYFLDNAHIQALVDRDGEPLTLVENTDYTLTGAGDESGGTLTTIAGTAADLVAGDVVTIRRNITITQLVNYVYNDSFPAETHEQALDKLTMICQFLNEMLARTLRFPPTEPEGYDSIVPDAATRADAVLTFDSEGSPSVITKQQLIDDLSLLDPSVTIGTAGKALLALESIATDKILGRSTAGTGNFELLTCTAVGRAVLAAATAAAQRTALGLGTASVLNVPASGNASASEVVKGDDTRLMTQTRLISTADLTKNNTTLEDIPGLVTGSLEAGDYRVEATIFVNQDTTGGSKIALTGTATASAATYDVSTVHAVATGFSNTRVTALGSAVASSGSAGAVMRYDLDGVVTISVAGTLKLQFAQNSANATSTAQQRSIFVVTKI